MAPQITGVVIPRQLGRTNHAAQNALAKKFSSRNGSRFDLSNGESSCVSVCGISASSGLMRQLNAMIKLKSRNGTANTSAVRDLTHGWTLLPSIIHHAPRTTSNSHAIGLKAQWLFGHPGTARPNTGTTNNT